MDVILASSRGKGYLQQQLKKHHPYPRNLLVQARGGAKLENLEREAVDILRTSKDPSNYHVYFLAGLCDITYMDRYIDHRDRRGRPHFYEEVSFVEDNSHAILRVTHIINSISSTIKSLGAKPCFITIPPCSIENWNLHRLNTGRTTHLIHHTQYQDMQNNLITVIQEINRTIVSTNNYNGMTTPFLAATIIKGSQPGNLNRIHYDRLVDGTHATTSTNDKWAKIILKTIKKNRHSEPPTLTTPINVITSHRTKPKASRRPPTLKTATRQTTHQPTPQHTQPISISSDSESEDEEKRPWRPQ